MQPVILSQDFKQIYNKGYLEDPANFIEEVAVIDDRGFITGYRGQYAKGKSGVVMTIWTVAGRRRDDAPAEVTLHWNDGSSITLEPGDQLELLGTVHNAYATGIQVIRNTVKDTSPLHREAITLRGLKRIVPRFLP